MAFSIIKLASDLIQHIFLITLLGLIFFEYFRVKYNLRQMNIIDAMRYRKALQLIFAIVLMATVWFAGEYFFAGQGFWYFIFARWPLVFFIFLLFGVFIVRFILSSWQIHGGQAGYNYIHWLSYAIFPIFLASFILLDIIYFFDGSPLIFLILIIERMGAMLAFFFSFLYYFIRNRPEELKVNPSANPSANWRIGGRIGG